MQQKISTRAIILGGKSLIEILIDAASVWGKNLAVIIAKNPKIPWPDKIMANKPSRRYHAGSKRSIYAVLSEMHGLGMETFATWDRNGELERKLSFLAAGKLLQIENIPRPRNRKTVKK